MISENNKYLKSEIYYSDLYDRQTVEECRRLEKIMLTEKEGEKSEMDKMKEGFSKKIICPVSMCFITGERYFNKKETVRKWMEEDEERNRKLENAVPPEDVFCLSCNSRMIANEKDLSLTYPDIKEEKVLFFFDCTNCRGKRGVWEDGKEWRPKLSCSKCRGGDIEDASKRVGNIITNTYKCRSCGNIQESIWDLNEKSKEEEVDPNFIKDRERFCMSEKEGDEYVGGRYTLIHATDLIMAAQEKEKIKEKAVNFKKLNIAELPKILNPVLEKDEYINLELLKPEILRDVIVGFTVQDNKADRTEYQSEQNLKKIIELSLANTNWRLMSDGVNYRLGILSGRLRGYESEEDILKLMKQIAAE